MTTRRAADQDRKTGSEEYLRFMARMIRSYGRKARAGEIDATSLTQLREIRQLLDEQEREVVAALRTEEGGSHSWSQIADALGIARSAAIRKYGSTEASARRVGGQPAHLR